VRRAGWPLALAGCLCLASPAAAARSAVTASLQPSFLPKVLGARTAFTLGFRLRGGFEGVPPPISRVVLRFPAGLAIDLSGAATCSAGRLRRLGRAGCPASSLIARGQAVAAVHAGSQSIPEQATVRAFRGPDRGGRPTVLIHSHGDTPLQQTTLSTGVLARDGGPYGLRLTVSVPPIPTLVLEPNASILSMSLTFGAAGVPPRAHAASGTVRVPRRCPAGGFPFAASFAFEDGTALSAAARVRCP
jgi:hypothetical protein